MSEEIKKDPTLDFSHRVVRVGRCTGRPGRWKDLGEVRNETIEEFAAPHSHRFLVEPREVLPESRLRISRDIFKGKRGNRRPLIAGQGTLGDVKNRVGALRYEKLLLECQTKSSVDAGVPLETFLGNVAEADRPEPDKFVPAKAATTRNCHRSRGD
jgi:hypothetical protein